MHNCGQNVYSLRTTPWTTCVGASTASHAAPRRTADHGYNPRVIRSFVRTLSQWFSTVGVHKFTSVYYSLFHAIHTTYNYLHELKKGKRLQ